MMLAATGGRAVDEMMRALGRLVGRPLLRVEHRCFASADPSDAPRAHDWVTDIKLTFQGRTLCIAVDPDTDTLSIGSSRVRARSDQVWRDATSRKPWRRWIGSPLRFAWTCINTSGYLDGVQLGFREYHPAVFLLAVASAIHEYSTTEVKERTGRPPRSLQRTP